MILSLLSGNRKSNRRRSGLRRSRKSLLRLEALESRSTPALVTWDGGGGDFNWNNAANWNTDRLPTSLDDAVIDVAETITVTHTAGVTAIRSLTCQESFSVTGGTFRVTAGASVVRGALSVGGNAGLFAQGSGVSFTAAGATNLTGANLQALNGALLDLSQATSFTGVAGSIMSANSGGNLKLSGVTSVTGPLAVSAANGGLVNLSAATSFAGGAVSFTVTGAAAVIDLSDLTSFGGAAPSFVLVLGGRIRCAELTLPVGSQVSGTGVLEGKVTNGGLIRPGLNTFNSTGVITVTGDYAQTATGTLAIKVNGAVAGAFDQLAVGGNASLDGILNVTRPTGFVPALGNTFQIMSFASRTGAFVKMNGLTIDATKRFDPVFGPTSLRLVTAPFNQAPILNPIGDHGGDEGSVISFTATATDPDAGDTLTFSLDAGAPAGAIIDPQTGVFTWTPPDGPAEFFVTIRVTDSGSPGLSDFETIRITVANVAPVVSAGGDQSAPKSSPFVRIGSLSDPGADTWTVIADYGDTTGNHILALNPDKTFELNHLYSAAGVYTVTVTVTDDDGDADTTSFVLTVLPPPAIESIVIEDGAAQRSMVRSVTVTFDSIVTYEDGAFQLAKQGNGLVALNSLSQTLGGKTVVSLTFADGTDFPGAFRSLSDGRYSLAILGAKITGNLGQFLDGDADGNQGGDGSRAFHRLFGDGDGDADVDQFDRRLFMCSFNKSVGDPGFLWYFDYNGDGRVHAHDLVQFNHRYGTILP